jgi:enolase
MRVERITALEILDSRGFPALEVFIEAGGQRARASVPSGKSTGKNEALERRDGDKSRYGGKGVLAAASAVETEIAAKVVGAELPPQAALDQMLITLDGTPNKGRLGANAILGVSMAAARLRAQLEGKPLYESLGGHGATILPVPCFNVLNGGAHADNPLDFQEFMIAPAGRPTFAEALRAGSEVYHALAKILESRKLSVSVGDEGGFAPKITHPVEALDLLVEAIGKAGYAPGKDVFIALDPAASAFFKDGRYVFAGQSLDAKGMTTMFGNWLKSYPILSIEDGLAEDDFAGWAHLTRELGSQLQIVGDDIFVSDPARVREAIATKTANAVLLKPNQIGSVTEITETARVAKAGGFRCMMSHRSGETQDDFIADLVVALGVGQIKSGAPARGERVAKYNQLLRIEKELGSRAHYAGIEAFRRLG